VTSSVWTASALLSNVATERRQGKELMLTHTRHLVDMNTLDILPSNISTGLPTALFPPTVLLAMIFKF
jgi:hypothetical protein